MVAINRISSSNSWGTHASKLATQGSELVAGSATSVLDRLTTEQQERLGQILDAYLMGLEAGEPLAIEELQRANPDLAQALSLYLDKLRVLHDVNLGLNKLGLANYSFADPAIVDEEFADSDLNCSPKLQRLGDFQLIAPIGRGGMGIVYEALQLSMNRRVAIKLLPIFAAMNETQVARFQNEARSAGLLEHPNIVPIYSVGSDRGIHYFAMQFIDGLSLDRWIELRGRAEDTRVELDDLMEASSTDHSGHAVSQSGTRGCAPEKKRELNSIDSGVTSWQSIVRWIIEIAEALHSAHCAGVIHRDVKPSNLMLDRKGKIWITDFGLARSNEDVSLTGSGEMLGTIRYMSPEQACGKSALVDGRCDQYSLAVTLYELLALQPVYNASTVAEVLRQMDGNHVVPLRKIRPDLPRDLGTVIAKAMSKSRDSRYETAKEFGEDLRRALESRPTLAQPPSFVDLALHAASRHRGVTAVSVLFVLISIVAMSVATVMFASLQRTASRNETRAFEQELLARTAVNHLGAETAELLASVPGAALVRERVLRGTLKYYEGFIASANQNPLLRTDVAITLGKIGSLQMELGRRMEAIENLRSSEQKLAELVAIDAGSTDVQLQWLIAQNNLGEALARTGSFQEAAKWYALAIEHGQEHSANARFLNQLATTHNNLGLLLAEVGATEQARQAFEQALKLIELQSTGDDLASTGPALARKPNAQALLMDDTPKLRRATVLGNMSSLLIVSAPEQAVTFAKVALEEQLEQLELRPHDAKFAAEVISTLNKLGTAHSVHGDYRIAAETLSRAVELGDELVSRQPNVTEHLEGLLVALNSLGLASTRANSLTQAADAFERAMEISRHLRQLEPDRADVLSLHASVLNNAALLQQLRGNREIAIQYCREAVDLQTRAVSASPSITRFQNLLEQHQRNLHDLIRGQDLTVEGA